MAAFDLLGRRGALRVIWELREGRVLTFRALAEAAALPPATLNARLKELRQAGLIALAQGYRLSPFGERLDRALGPLNGWAQEWSRASGRAAAKGPAATD